MAGIGDESFLFFIILREWFNDMFGQQDHQNQDHHQSETGYTAADQQNIAETVQTPAAVQENNTDMTLISFCTKISIGVHKALGFTAVFI